MLSDDIFVWGGARGVHTCALFFLKCRGISAHKIRNKLKEYLPIDEATYTSVMTTQRIGRTVTREPRDRRLEKIRAPSVMAVWRTGEQDNITSTKVTE